VCVTDYIHRCTVTDVKYKTVHLCVCERERHVCA